MTRQLLILPVLVLAVAPALIAAPANAAAPTTGAGSAQRVERALLYCANRERRARGISPLAIHPALGAAAHAHARAMLRRHFFDHRDPSGRDPVDRVAAVDPTFGDFVGENIYLGPRSAGEACRGWMRSVGHRRNILDPEYTVIGAGYARGRGGTYYVQVFGDPAPPDPSSPPSTDGEEVPVQ